MTRRLHPGANASSYVFPGEVGGFFKLGGRVNSADCRLICHGPVGSRLKEPQELGMLLEIRKTDKQRTSCELT